MLWKMLEAWIASLGWGCPLWLWSILVFSWELCLRQNIYEMVLLKRWNIVWQVGSSFICQRVIGSLWLKALFPILPTYFLSFFSIAVGVANCIKKLQRDFMWGRVGDEFRYHFVGWSKICTGFFFKLSWGNDYGVTPERERGFVGISGGS